MWNEGFDAHFYVKDFDLDVIKRLFALSYYTAVPVKKIFDFPEWWDTKYLAPTPTADVVKRALAQILLKTSSRYLAMVPTAAHPLLA